jgi:hypothetical protein
MEVPAVAETVTHGGIPIEMVVVVDKTVGMVDLEEELENMHHKH